jgi:hypothetical protein
MNNYEIRAIGWSLALEAFNMSKDVSLSFRKWCRQNDYDFDYIPRKLTSNGGFMSSETLPETQKHNFLLLDMNRFFLLSSDSTSLVPLTAPLVANSLVKLRRDRDGDISYIRSRGGKTLISLEEFKGTGAVWRLRCKSSPVLEKFTICYSKLCLGSDSSYFTTALKYDGRILERVAGGEVLTPKGVYSKVL